MTCRNSYQGKVILLKKCFIPYFTIQHGYIFDFTFDFYDNPLLVKVKELISMINIFSSHGLMN